MTGKRQVCTATGCTRESVGRRLCRKHYQAAWKAGAFENVPLPPRVKNPMICPSDHKHGGSLVCYNLHQCRCEGCRENRSENDRRRAKLKAYGRYDRGLVDAEPVREHMLMLAEFGMGYKHVARLAGLGVTPVRNLVWGRQEPGPRYGELQKRVKRETAEAILAVQPTLENLAGGVGVPSRGTHRRLQALVAIGWSLSKLGDRLGVLPSNMSTLMKRERVSAETHRAVVALFDELWNVTPPCESHRDKIAFSRAKNYAKARRWLPPLAWDDIDEDEQPPVPDEFDGIDDVVVDLAVSGENVRLSSAERREAVRRANALGLSDAAIGERLRIAARSVLRIRQELGIEAAVGADGERVAA